MIEKGRIEKTIKPSQRKSITEFSTRFGAGPSYEERVRAKRIALAVLIAAGILALIAVGYFFTDVLVKITELPYQPAAHIDYTHTILRNMYNGLYTL